MSDSNNSHEFLDLSLTDRPNPKPKMKFLTFVLFVVSLILTGAGFLFFVCRFLVPLPLCLSTLSKLSLFVTGQMQNIAFILLLIGIVLSTITYGLARRLKIKKVQKLISRICILCLICLAVMTYLCIDFLSRQRIAAWLCKPGYRLTFACQNWDDSVKTLSRDTFEELRWTVTKRLDSEPIGCVRIVAVPPDRITIAFDKRIFSPEQRVENLIRFVERPGFLEFRILPTIGGNHLSKEEITVYSEALASKGPESTLDNKYVWVELMDLEKWHCPNSIVGQFNGRKYVMASNTSDECLLYNTEKNSWKLERAYLTVDSMGRCAVGFILDEAGGIKFSNLTSNNRERPLCIILDDTAISAPNIETRISRQGIITGSFTYTEAWDIVSILNSHPLPAKLRFVKQGTNDMEK